MIIFAAAALSLATASQESKASDSAKSFSLDLGSMPADNAVTAPAEPAQPVAADDAVTTEAPPAPPADEGKQTASAPKGPALFTLDTPIGQLIADPRARAVLEKDLPGLTTDENLPKFRALSLRRFQPLTGGQMSDDLLKRAEADLATIQPSATKALAGKRKLDSR